MIARFADQPKLDERAIERIFLCRSRLARWRVRTDEAVYVTLKRRRRNAREPELLDHSLELPLELSPREARARILVEDPPPGRRALTRCSDPPVDEPQRADILEVGIPAVV